MSTKEMIDEIDKKIRQFNDKQLEVVLSLVNKIENIQITRYDINEELSNVMEEDINLLKRLAK